MAAETKVLGYLLCIAVLSGGNRFNQEFSFSISFILSRHFEGRRVYFLSLHFLLKGEVMPRYTKNGLEITNCEKPNQLNNTVMVSFKCKLLDMKMHQFP